MPYVLVILFFFFLALFTGVTNMGRNLRIALICGLLAQLFAGSGIIIFLLAYLILGLFFPEKPKTYIEGVKERARSLFWKWSV